MKRALIVGINKYHPSIGSLKNAVNDALALAKVLERNERQFERDTKRLNYDVRCLLGDEKNIVTREELYRQIRWLFKGDHEDVLFFFAGHAARSKLDDKDYLVTSDAELGSLGVDMDFVLRQANSSNLRSATILLDCCHSGSIASDHTDRTSALGKGVTIVTACDNDEEASDFGSRVGHGAFTSLLLDALEGQAADILGRVTPASIYALIDSRLSPSQQRPIFKSNVNQFIEIRQATPRIFPSQLEEMRSVFTPPDLHHQLDPSYETVAGRGEGFEKRFGEIPFNRKNYEVFETLRAAWNNGLVEVICEEKPKWWNEHVGRTFPPKGGLSMWHAAVFSLNVHLTPKGLHYWNIGGA